MDTDGAQKGPPQQISPETWGTLTPWEKEFAETLLLDFPTLTEKKILDAIKAA